MFSAYMFHSLTEKYLFGCLLMPKIKIPFDDVLFSYSDLVPSLLIPVEYMPIDSPMEYHFTVPLGEI